MSAKVKGGSGVLRALPKTTEKAAYAFAWLRAVKRCPNLKAVDAVTALDLVELLDDDLCLFRSAAALGRAIRCSESTAEASLGRLRRAGLIVLVEQGGKGPVGPNGGRRANTYRIAVEEFSPEIFGKTGLEVSHEKLGKTAIKADGVSPKFSGMVSPDNSGTISLEQSQEGAGALGARPAPPPCEVSFGEYNDDYQLLEDDGDGRALGTPITVSAVSHPAAMTEAPGPASEPSLASVPEDEDRPPVDVTKVTLADLDAREAEELAAEIAADPFFGGLDGDPSPPGWDARPSIDALRELWGDALPPELRPEAVARRCAHILVWQDRPAAVREWNAIKARFYAVLRERQHTGPGVIKAFGAWREEIGRLGRIGKERENAEREDFSLLGGSEPGSEHFLETRHAWGS